MTKHIAILRGDGIGPEIVAETVRVLDKLIAQGLDASYEYAPLGGEAYDEYGHPYPEFTQNLCRKADAVLLGAVGSPQYDNLDRPLRPERGLLAIRKDLNLFPEPVCQPAPRHPLPRACQRFHAQTRNRRRPRHPYRTRTDRRYLLWRTARHPCFGKRRTRRL